jgi:uncharacterized protein (DUF1684 family)
MLRILATVTVSMAVLCCVPAGGVSMEPAPPPSGWEGELSSERADKDQRFREDPESPLLPGDREGFRGLEYWPPDPAYLFLGTIRLHDSPERFEILTTTGKPRPCEKYGSVSFEIGGRRCELQVYRLLDVPDPDAAENLFLPFTDKTSGRESYPAGRYVDLQDAAGGKYLLDFNRAYNPLCAYGAPERFICPATPRENHLPVRLEAGERGYRKGA